MKCVCWYEWIFVFIFIINYPHQLGDNYICFIIIFSAANITARFNRLFSFFFKLFLLSDIYIRVVLDLKVRSCWRSRDWIVQISTAADPRSDRNAPSADRSCPQRWQGTCGCYHAGWFWSAKEGIFRISPHLASVVAFWCGR